MIYKSVYLPREVKGRNKEQLRLIYKNVVPPSSAPENNTLGELNKSTDSATKKDTTQVSNHDQPANMDATSTDHPQYTEDEKKIYVRYHAVMDVVVAGKMGQVTTMDVKYLAGRDSGYHSLHSSHHSMS